MKMNKSKFGLVFLFTLGTLVSCEKEMDATDTVTTEVLPDESGYFVEQEGVEYHDGPVVKIGNHDIAEMELAAKKPRVHGTWKRLTAGNMNKLGYSSTDFNLNRFTAVLNKGTRRPKNVSVNGFKYGPERSASANQGWNVDVRTWGVRQKIVTSKNTPIKAVPGFSLRRLRNNKKTRQWMKPNDKEWKRSITNTRGWSVTGSRTMEIGTSLSIPFGGGGNVGASASMSVTLEHGKSNSTEVTFEEGFTSAGRWVPPGKTAVFQVVERHKIQRTEWVVPVEFRGKVGANYGSKKHHGSHFWSVSAPAFFYEYNPKLRNDYRRMVIKTHEDVLKEAWVRSWIE